MNLYEGQIYKDDRIFILDLTQAKKGNNSVWAIITRRNIDGFPPTRTDEFETKEKAIEYIKQIEPTTPRISLNGKSPKIPESYDKGCKQLKKEGILMSKPTNYREEVSINHKMKDRILYYISKFLEME